MTSRNFEFLRPYRPELADLAAFAEQYAYGDPVSAVVKLRSFAETVTWDLYRHHRLRPPVPDDFVRLLTDWQFKAAVPLIVADQLHAIRKAGNVAAHANKADTQTAVLLIEQAFKLACWYAATVAGISPSAAPAFQPIPASEPFWVTESRLNEEKRAALEELARQKNQLDSVVAELAATRNQYDAVEKKLEELQSIGVSGTQTLSLLQIDEASTRRRLIDVALVQTGWKVGANGSSTSEVTQEQEVGSQPTASGKGYADYVLWDDDGTPIGVIEAKRTMRDPEQGRKQAALYADALEKEHGHRPVIFYTNGHEVFVWDDAQGYPPRKLFGFYSKDSLRYRGRFQRTARRPLETVAIRNDIVERMYQLEAIKRVNEKFSEKRRRALITQATGTGKTRVSIAMADVLIRANWVKRVLFLCDRRELRKQAKNAFAQFLNEPLTVVNASTAADKDKRIYISTYPAMMEAFQNYDPGFFDLIIADESHRSIYNVYLDLFRYFDCLQVGLTATPVDFISRNTYQMFDCPDMDPTAYYPLERAVEEGYLVPYEVFAHTTKFLREGIKYADLTPDQQRQVEEDGHDPALVDHDQGQIDKQVFNKDTARAMIRNLMENGLRDRTGQRVGKTIIFARSHDHAVLLSQVFDDMYPQYGGKFCQVIDYQMERAEQLIDDFKGEGSNPDLTIAISVDMLDTGIDVPEIVNLVFAKPVMSKVKFWQMIGRGTRLCKNLFGPGEHKTKFRIFDHWGNFDFFGQAQPQAQPTRSRSLMEQVFAARIELAEATLQAAKPASFQWVIGLIDGDVRSLPDDSISVRELFMQVETVKQAGRLEQWSASTVDVLRRDITPLMQWADIAGSEQAYRLDLLIAQMQIALLKGAGKFSDLRAELLNRVNNLQMNLNPVKDKAEVIQRVRSGDFWTNVTVEQLEQVRQELRGIMRYQNQIDLPRPKPVVYDIQEQQAETRFEKRSALLSSVDMVAYRLRVEEALKSLFATNATLERIRLGLPVSEVDLEALRSLVLTQHPDIDIADLMEFYPQESAHLDEILRTIIGMEPEVVKERFTTFVQKNPALSARQTQFVQMLVNHISRYGRLETEKLYDPPFTSLHSDGIDGLFEDETQVNELLAIVQSFNPQPSTGEELTQ
ncbi:MAG: DEAD/DEAH box helicase family protein [Fimbriimonadaceae bacterium]|nr:DEAD/DEAH box helicase family protein [Fimbriimonadaceae bacterium]